MIRYQNEEYDVAFKNIDGLKYDPWVGCDYGKLSRVMIVAESVYDWSKEDDTDERKAETKRVLNSRDFAQCVVLNNGICLPSNKFRSINSRTFRNLECAIYGKEGAAISVHDRERLWKQVSFHELIQRPMSSSGERPNGKDYKLSAEVLAKTFEMLQPQHVLMFGTNWRNVRHALSWLKYQGDEEKISGCIPRRFAVNVKNCRAALVMIQHPGGCFSWPKWHPYIKSHMAGWRICDA